MAKTVNYKNIERIIMNHQNNHQNHRAKKVVGHNHPNLYFQICPYKTSLNVISIQNVF